MGKGHFAGVRRFEVHSISCHDFSQVHKIWTGELLVYLSRVTCKNFLVLLHVEKFFLTCLSQRRFRNHFTFHFSLSRVCNYPSSHYCRGYRNCGASDSQEREVTEDLNFRQLSLSLSPSVCYLGERFFLAIPLCAGFWFENIDSTLSTLDEVSLALPIEIKKENLSSRQTDSLETKDRESRSALSSHRLDYLIRIHIISERTKC